MAKVALGTAYMQIVPSMEGVGKSIQQTMTQATASIGASAGNSFAAKFSSGMATAGANLQRWGGQLQTVGGKLTSGITKPAVAAAGVVGGLVTALGFKRLVGIDTARAQFKGLGLDADKVMAQVDKGVQNTALSMADGASMAVGILATGAVPLQDLEAQIKRVANVSAAYNVDSSQAAYLLNNVLTKQKVTWGDLSQMQRNQIPIVTQLAEHYGVAGDEIMKMAQEGKISVEDLNEVLDKNAGSAAEEYAKSWKGMTENILSNVGRLGATLLGEVFPQLKDGAADLLDKLKSDELQQWAEETGQKIGDLFREVGDRIRAVKDWWNELNPTVKEWAVRIGAAAVVAGPFLTILGKILSVVGGLMTAFRVIGPVIAAVTSPIGLVVAAIAGLVAGFIWAWNNIDGFKEFFIGVWDRIKEVAQTVSDWVTETLVPALVAAWDWLMEATEPLRDAVAGTWEDIMAAVQVVSDWFTGTFWPAFSELWESVEELVTAVWERIAPWIEEKVGAIRDVIEVFLDWIGPHWEATWDVIGAVIEFVWDLITGTVETAMGVIQGVIDTITAVIEGDWEAVWDNIGGIFETIWNGMEETVNTIIDGIENVISTTLDSIQSTWENTWTTVGNFLSEKWDGIRETVAGGVMRAYEKATELKDKVVGFFSGAGTWLVDSGKALIQGFTDGITSAFSGAWEAVSEGLASLRSLLPFSPAREGPFSGRGWTRYSGLALIGDMAAGIDAATPGLVSAAEASMADTQRALSGHASLGLFDPGGGALAGGVAPLLPESLVLRVGSREFTAYLSDELGANGSGAAWVGVN